MPLSINEIRDRALIKEYFPATSKVRHRQGRSFSPFFPKFEK
jgi:hypothetical protein